MPYDVTHVWSLAKKLIRSVLDNWFIIAFFAGVLLIVIAHFGVVDFNSDNSEVVAKYNSLLENLGKVIVFSGIFASFTRWLSVHSIVKKEIEKILYGGEHFKDNAKFEDLWRRIIDSSIDQHMPHLKPHLKPDMLKKYLPSENELFFSSYHQRLDITWKDRAKRTIAITEHCDIVVLTNSAEKHLLPYRYTAEYPESDEANYEYSIEVLKIDGEDRISSVGVDRVIVNGTVKKTLSYELSLNGDTEYQLYRKMTRTICLDNEPFSLLSCSTHTYKPKVTICCQDVDIKAFFTSTGVRDDFVTIDGENHTCYMQEQYPHLLLKGQGYSIYYAS